MRVRLRLHRLRQLMARSPLSQNHWAIRLGLSRGHWSDILNGRYPYLSAKTRGRLLEEFGVAFDDLFEVEAVMPEGGSGAIADRYILDVELGRGGMGVVYLARDTRYGRPVALKLISAEAVSGIGVDRFFREISYTAQLQHQHILTLLDSGVADGQPFYVMPYVRGGSLRDLLDRDHRLALDDALPLIKGVALALDHAHRHSILHCDVKPANVLVSQGHAYVTDFGVARAIHAEYFEWGGRTRDRVDSSAGTPAYVSPEQANGERDLDGRSDLYSLGCMVYEMLAGRPPFAGRTTVETVARRFTGPVPDLRAAAPGLPAGVAAVVQRAMARGPTERPTTVMTFWRDLVRAVEREATVVGRATGHVHRTTQRLARRFAPRPVAALAATADAFGRELRQATRRLARSPRFSVGVILSIALGLGVGLPAFGLVDTLFLHGPPHVREPDRVMRLAVAIRGPEGTRFWSGGISGLDFTVMRERSRSLEAVAAWVPWSPSWGRGPNATTISAVGATGAYFRVLGVQPTLGRFYDEAEDVPGTVSPPAVISYGFWKRAFAGDTTVLGREMRVGSLTATIVGVTPPTFTGAALSSVDVWVPLRAASPDINGDEKLWSTDRSWWVRVIARRKRGVSLAAADAEAAVLYRTSAPRIRDPSLSGTFRWESILPGRALTPNATARITLWLLGGAVLLLVLIAANVVNLFLARGSARAQDVAVRLAIGGGRRRVLGGMLVEAGLLTTSAAVGALALSVPVTRIARSLLLPWVSWAQPAFNTRQALVAMGAAVVLGFVVAMLSFVRTAREDTLPSVIASGSHRVAGGGQRLRGSLVLLQAAVFAGLMVAGAGFLNSLRRATAVPLGFEVDHLVIAQVPLGLAGYDRSASRQFYRDAATEVRRLPYVADASIGYTVPWLMNRGERVSAPRSADSLPYTYFDAVTPSHFATLGLKMRSGRWIGESDRAGTSPVVVVNETLARLAWPRSNPLGRCLRVGGDSLPCRDVVGVVADHRFTGALDDPPVPAVFVPYEQSAGYDFTSKLFVRVRGNADDRAREIGRVVQGLRPDLPAGRVWVARDQYDRVFATLRVGAAMFATFGGLAAMIGGFGLYSVLAFAVTARRQEFAIRTALGAAPPQVVRPVLGQGVTLAAAGAVVGIVAALLARGVLEPLLFHTRLDEPLPLLATMTTVVVIGLVASVAPARRAAQADPMKLLHEQ